MEYFPYRISIHPRLENRPGINIYTIDKAAKQFANKITQRDPKPTLYKKYNDTIMVDGTRVFIVGEFHEDKSFHICEAKKACGGKFR